MKKLALLLSLALSFQAFASQYLVKYRNQQGALAVLSPKIQSGLQMQVLDTHPEGNLILVNIPDSKKVHSIVELLSNPDIQYVVPNFKLYSLSSLSAKQLASMPVQATALQDQWAITKVQAAKAWQRAGNKGSKNVLLAVIDTGVDYNHKSLSSNVVKGYNFVNNNDDPMDIVDSNPMEEGNPGHGTHCAGIIGANGVVDGGTIGISPDISIMPLRFLDEKGSGDLNNGIKAIDYAIAHNVQVISASWGAQVPASQAQPLIEAVKRATDKGIIFVVAAGNGDASGRGLDNDTTDFFPANVPADNLINVAASDSNDGKPSWSNYGKAKVHVSSPGLNILSTLPGDKYGQLSGTSMATPLVAGMVAFLKAQDSSLTGVQVKALLQTTGVKNSIETACNCRVDAFNAVDALLSKKAWIYPAAATLAEKATVQLGVKNMGSGVTYTSSNPSVITVDGSGLVTAVAKGTAQVTAKDSSGATATSLDINVGAQSDNGGGGNGGDGGDGGNGGGGGGGGGSGSCPIGDPQMC
jgi:thermitase